jgi:hypothetical protein
LDGGRTGWWQGEMKTFQIVVECTFRNCGKPKDILEKEIHRFYSLGIPKTLSEVKQERRERGMREYGII